MLYTLRLNSLWHIMASHVWRAPIDLGQAVRTPSAPANKGEYAYLANGHLVEAAEKVGNAIASAMANQTYR